MYNAMRGILVEYSLTVPPLTLVFEFNPETLSRTRSITLKEQTAPGTAGGYDFAAPSETPRISQGVEVKAEEFSIDILIDATDRMNNGDPVVQFAGIGPELDTLRTMVEPKSQGPNGLQTLASLGHGGGRAFQRNTHASVLLFIWGTHVLPVFLTSVKVDEKAHLPNLVPYRAQATLSFQVIEGNNPFYEAEKVRQIIGAGLNTASTVSSTVGGLF